MTRPRTFGLSKASLPRDTKRVSRRSKPRARQTSVASLSSLIQSDWLEICTAPTANSAVSRAAWRCPCPRHSPTWSPITTARCHAAWRSSPAVLLQPISLDGLEVGCPFGEIRADELDLTHRQRRAGAFLAQPCDSPLELRKPIVRGEARYADVG